MLPLVRQEAARKRTGNSRRFLAGENGQESKVEHVFFASVNLPPANAPPSQRQEWHLALI